MNIGNTYDLFLKYPVALGGTKRNNLKLVAKTIGINFVSTIQDVITLHSSVLQEASTSDIIHSMKLTELEFLVFTDIENNNLVVATEYIRSYIESGNNYKFEIKNISINEKMVVLKTLRNLGFTVTEA